MPVIGKCIMCKQKKGRRYFVYKYTFVTSKTTYHIPLLKLMEDLNKWIMNNRVHLSASQLILLRPDILEKFYKETKLKQSPEELIQGFLEENEVCEDCYQNYIKQVPLL